MAKISFQDIMDEIINQFIFGMNVNVKISVEIEASTPARFDENVQRFVKENCNVLKLDTAK